MCLLSVMYVLLKRVCRLNVTAIRFERYQF